MPDLKQLIAEGSRLWDAANVEIETSTMRVQRLEWVNWTDDHFDALLSAAREALDLREKAAALSAENERLRAQVTRLQEASTAELLKHREERDRLQKLAFRYQAALACIAGQQSGWPATDADAMRLRAEAALGAATEARPEGEEGR